VKLALGNRFQRNRGCAMTAASIEENQINQGPTIS
jgi:hypothetical protein